MSLPGACTKWSLGSFPTQIILWFYNSSTPQSLKNELQWIVSLVIQLGNLYCEKRSCWFPYFLPNHQAHTSNHHHTSHPLLVSKSIIFPIPLIKKFNTFLHLCSVSDSWIPVFCGDGEPRSGWAWSNLLEWKASLSMGWGGLQGPCQPRPVWDSLIWLILWFAINI